MESDKENALQNALLTCKEFSSIYKDIEGFDLGKQIEELKEDNQLLADHIVSLEGDVEKLTTALLKLKLIQENLTKNISSLFLTAKSEIDRKDCIIADLRGQLDDLTFRRMGITQKRKPVETLEANNKKARYEETTEKSDDAPTALRINEKEVIVLDEGASSSKNVPKNNVLTCDRQNRHSSTKVQDKTYGYEESNYHYNNNRNYGDQRIRSKSRDRRKNYDDSAYSRRPGQFEDQRRHNYSENQRYHSQEYGARERRETNSEQEDASHNEYTKLEVVSCQSTHLQEKSAKKTVEKVRKKLQVVHKLEEERKKNQEEKFSKFIPNSPLEGTRKSSTRKANESIGTFFTDGIDEIMDGVLQDVHKLIPAKKKSPDPNLNNHKQSYSDFCETEEHKTKRTKKNEFRTKELLEKNQDKQSESSTKNSERCEHVYNFDYSSGESGTVRDNIMKQSDMASVLRQSLIVPQNLEESKGPSKGIIIVSNILVPEESDNKNVLTSVNTDKSSDFDPKTKVMLYLSNMNEQMEESMLISNSEQCHEKSIIAEKQIIKHEQENEDVLHKRKEIDRGLENKEKSTKPANQDNLNEIENKKKQSTGKSSDENLTVKPKLSDQKNKKLESLDRIPRMDPSYKIPKKDPTQNDINTQVDKYNPFGENCETEKSRLCPERTSERTNKFEHEHPRDNLRSYRSKSVGRLKNRAPSPSYYHKEDYPAHRSRSRVQYENGHRSKSTARSDSSGHRSKKETENTHSSRSSSKDATSRHRSRSINETNQNRSKSISEVNGESTRKLTSRSRSPTRSSRNRSKSISDARNSKRRSSRSRSTTREAETNSRKRSKSISEGNEAGACPKSNRTVLAEPSRKRETEEATRSRSVTPMPSGDPVGSKKEREANDKDNTSTKHSSRSNSPGRRTPGECRHSKDNYFNRVIDYQQYTSGRLLDRRETCIKGSMGSGSGSNISTPEHGMLEDGELLDTNSENDERYPTVSRLESKYSPCQGATDEDVQLNFEEMKGTKNSTSEVQKTKPSTLPSTERNHASVKKTFAGESRTEEGVKTTGKYNKEAGREISSKLDSTNPISTAKQEDIVLPQHEDKKEKKEQQQEMSCEAKSTADTVMKKDSSIKQKEQILWKHPERIAKLGEQRTKETAHSEYDSKGSCQTVSQHSRTTKHTGDQAASDKQDKNAAPEKRRTTNTILTPKNQVVEKKDPSEQLSKNLEESQTKVKEEKIKTNNDTPRRKINDSKESKDKSVSSPTHLTEPSNRMKTSTEPNQETCMVLETKMPEGPNRITEETSNSVQHIQPVKLTKTNATITIKQKNKNKNEPVTLYGMRMRRKLEKINETSKKNSRKDLDSSLASEAVTTIPNISANKKNGTGTGTGEEKTSTSKNYLSEGDESENIKVGSKDKNIIISQQKPTPTLKAKEENKETSTVTEDGKRRKLENVINEISKRKSCEDVDTVDKNDSAGNKSLPVLAQLTPPESKINTIVSKYRHQKMQKKETKTSTVPLEYNSPTAEVVQNKSNNEASITDKHDSSISRLVSSTAVVEPLKNLTEESFSETVTIQSTPNKELPVRKRITPIPVKDSPVCSFENILEKNRSPFSENLSLRGSPLTLTHEGEIPVLHLEENHFYNLRGDCQKSVDTNIMSLLDQMNISNMDCDVIKFGASNEKTEIASASFKNVIETAPVSKPRDDPQNNVEDVNNCTAPDNGMRKDAPTPSGQNASARRRRCRLVVI